MKAIFLLFLLVSFPLVYALPDKELELSTFFIKTVIFKGEAASSTLQFINLGNEQTFSIEKNGNFFDVDKQEIFVKSGDSTSVSVSFNNSSLDEGVYVGNILLTSKKDSARIPVVLGVKSKQVLFDVTSSVSPQFTVLSPGDRLAADIKVINLGSLNKTVMLSYYVSDLDGNVIVSDSQTADVATTMGLSRDLSLPVDVPLGDYVFYVTAKSGSSFGLSAFLFTVSDKKKTTSQSYFMIVLALVLILLFLFLFFSYRWSRRLATSSQYWNDKVSELRKMKTGNLAKDLHKLQYELQLLENAYSKGYIKRSSYQETKNKIGEMIKQLRKRL